jgi:uncharacterized RDD family membrane protein YckC
MSAPAPDPLPVPTNFEPPTFGGYAGEPGRIRGVGFWPRVGARVIDLIVQYLIAVSAGFVFGVLVAVAARMAGQSASILLAKQGHPAFAVFVFALLGSVAYETTCEGWHGSTPGKLVLSMVVVQEDGTPCRPGPALVRSLAYFFDSLFFGIIAYLAMNKTPQEQRHGDVWAHTIVAKRSDAPAPSLRSGGRFASVFLFAAMADAALLMIGLLLGLR